jgi:PAS domain S-box-containing protein
MVPHSNKTVDSNYQHSSPVTIFSSQPQPLSVRSGSLMKRESARVERQAENTILVVNDAPELLEMMSFLLSQSGYHVLTAFDGLDGFEVARAERPRLVISDVSMPRMDGVELCRKVREHPDLRQTPVLLVSAIRKDSESVIKGLQAGADDYLEAPYDPVSLIAKVARLLERRKAEESLQRSEERWRSLIENSSDIITILATDGTISYESPSVTRILGYQPEELVGKNVFDFIHPNDLSQVTKGLTHTFERRGISKNLEYRFRHQNGSWCVFESVGKTFIDESGESVGVVNSRDITERKRAENELRKQKEILQKIFDHIPAMISFWDEKGRLKLVNREWARTVGYTLEEIEKQNLDIVAECYPDPQERQKVLDLFTSSSGEWMDLKPRVLDGRVICTSWAVVHLSDGTSISIGQDITERQRAAETVFKLAAIVESSDDAIIGKTLEGVITSWNKGAERLYGYQAEEVIGHSISLLIPPDHPDELPEILEKIGRGERVEHYETGRLRKDGQRLDISLTVSPIKTVDGVIVGASAIARDISARKQAEERLKSSNEKLRALSARLQSVREEESIRIAREIHDELGGALTGLKMDLSWLARRLPDTSNEAVQPHLKAMSDYIDETIQKVRNISTELRPSVLDDLGLAAAIKWQTREFQNRMEIKCEIISLREEVALSPEKSTAVFRIFQEILTNIARHAYATLVEISMEQQDGDLVLQVSDNGQGIKESDIADTKSLGLLGIRERALVFGGEVEITGEAGKGTTVMVRIPHE